ncbi:Hypothetical protein A7982_05143 [Minicystis rosea]|nr:Hypothetical protein A7982_05143 [Minicystis rosea]
MLETRTNPGDGRVVLALDEASLPRDAVYAAAFAFIDRCWVHLDRVGGRVEVTLRAKAANANLDALAQELQDELLGEAWRRKVVDENRALMEALAIEAFGTPGGAGAPDAGALDDLLADGDGAFDDPLGIAMSWEEKYAKKGDDTSKDEASSKDGSAGGATS